MSLQKPIMAFNAHTCMDKLLRIYYTWLLYDFVLYTSGVGDVLSISPAHFFFVIKYTKMRKIKKKQK